MYGLDKAAEERSERLKQYAENVQQKVEERPLKLRPHAEEIQQIIVERAIDRAALEGSKGSDKENDVNN